MRTKIHQTQRTTNRPFKFVRRQAQSFIAGHNGNNGKRGGHLPPIANSSIVDWVSCEYSFNYVPFSGRNFATIYDIDQRTAVNSFAIAMSHYCAATIGAIIVDIASTKCGERHIQSQTWLHRVSLIALSRVTTDQRRVRWTQHLVIERGCQTDPSNTTLKPQSHRAYDQVTTYLRPKHVGIVGKS